MKAAVEDEELLLLEAGCERQGSGVWHDPRDRRGRETRGGSDALCEYSQYGRGKGLTQWRAHTIC